MADILLNVHLVIFSLCADALQVLLLPGESRRWALPGEPVSAISILFGHIVWFPSLWLAAYMGFMYLAFHLFILLYEEPALRKKFGAAYGAYCKSVPRWMPKF